MRILLLSLSFLSLKFIEEFCLRSDLTYNDEIKLKIFDKLNFKKNRQVDKIKCQFLINFKQIFQYTFNFALNDKDI